MPMDEKLQQKNWTDYLKSLHLGTHSIVSLSIGEIDSIKSIGYRLNSQGYEKTYQFHANYKNLCLVVDVAKRQSL